MPLWSLVSVRWSIAPRKMEKMVGAIIEPCFSPVLILIGSLVSLLERMTAFIPSCRRQRKLTFSGKHISGKQSQKPWSVTQTQRMEIELSALAIPAPDWLSACMVEHTYTLIKVRSSSVL